MNQDINSNPPIAVPSTEFGALLFAILPCLRDAYRPFASFAYHFMELSKLNTLPALPSMTSLTNIDALIQDRNRVCQSLSFYGRLFHMPLLSTLGTLLQGFQFYQTYKDLFPGLLSSFQGENTGSPDALSGLLSLFGSMSGNPSTGGTLTDMFSSVFSAFSGAKDSAAGPSASEQTNQTEQPEQTNQAEQTQQSEQTEKPSDLYDSLYNFLTPEQKKIYEQLMHTDNIP